MRSPKSTKSLLPMVLGFSAVGLLGLVLLFLLVSERPLSSAPNKEQGDIQESASVQAPSPFMAHYVGMGGRFARIPSRFCPQEYYKGLHTIGRCPIGAFSLEIDLEEHRLPVERISHAVTDGNNRMIAYTVYKDVQEGDSCGMYDVFMYDLSSKEHKKIKNDPRMWNCGASASYLKAFSMGGRYLEIGSFGTHAGWPKYYDLQNDVFDEEISRYPGLVYFFSPEVSSEERYTIYTKGQDAFFGPDGIDESYTLHLRDNRKQKSVRLESIERQLVSQGAKVENILRIEYEPIRNVLTLQEEGLGGYTLTLPNFDRTIETLLK